jgi:uncharacterized protein YgiB involved in biofilm formation
MKRSRTASLVVMGLTPLFVSACGDTHKSQQEFASVDACTHAGVPADSCEEAFDGAYAQVMQFPPHYNSAALCDDHYEQSSCIETQDGSGTHYWFPTMRGFLIARVVQGSRVSYFPAGPVYRKRDNTDYSPRYGTVYSGVGGSWRSVPSDELAGEGDTVSHGFFGGDDEDTVSRGGFGGDEEESAHG